MMATDAGALAVLQTHVANRLDPPASHAASLAGIIGDHPSEYAKSPSLWNAAFKALQMDAVYLPFDVREPQLAGLVEALRRCDQLLGVNVTVPHKLAMLKHLDRLEEQARRIGAVNTVVRTPEGQLIGYNTDGSGFLRSLTEGVGGEAPLLPKPKGVNVLLIGAGGAARAVAFALASTIGKGRLFIANRTKASAASLAKDVGNGAAIGEGDIPTVIAGVELVVNGSTKGQAGTPLEGYSSLAPANDLRENHRLSQEAARALPKGAVAYDAIYAPPETVFLRHCREAGHRTANGRGMNIAQAVEAFELVCHDELQRHGLSTPASRRRITEAMASAFGVAG